jgi:uncharacterized protein (DUF2236 family)
VTDEELLEQNLAELRAGAPGVPEGLFGPGSAMWHVMRDVAMPLTGMRAVILQICHPAIAAAGARNSVLKESFRPRAKRTFRTMYEVMFADLDQVEAAGRTVHRIHTQVTGVVPAEAGGIHIGECYHANDPELLAWVLATLIDGAFVARERLLSPLPPELDEAFYQDMVRIGMVLGMPRDALPPSVTSYRAWFNDMLDSDELYAGPIAKDLVGFLMTDGWDLGPADDIWGAGLLPPRFRDAFGFTWHRRDQAAYHIMHQTLRATLRALPAELAYVPAYHRAQVRVARARGTSVPLRSRLVKKVTGEGMDFNRAR